MKFYEQFYRTRTKNLPNETLCEALTCYKVSERVVYYWWVIFLITTILRTTFTWTFLAARKVSKYGVFSGPYFTAFGLNTEIYGVSLRIQSECGEIRTRKNSVFGHFSRSSSSKYSNAHDNRNLWQWLIYPILSQCYIFPPENFRKIRSFLK